ncbi:MAG: signal peptidase I, partial [Oceanospirillum sp.]|nr:signal peptidase I [Oceanospirillum sp.]
MDFDFALALVIAVAVTGIGYAVDAFFFAPKRKQAINAFLNQPQRSVMDAEVINQLEKEPLWAEYSRSFFPVLFLVLIVRSFVVEPFQIPSGSMLPTLKIGDFILVNKFSYGLRLPVGHSRIIEVDDPERGDVMVFRYPKDDKVNYIKRVIGLPGDRLRYENKVLYINGEPAAQQFVAALPAGNPNRKLLRESLG